MSLIRLMALRHSAFYAPYLATMSGGFLAAEGLEYEYTVQTTDNTIADAFANGRCDVSQSAVAVSFAGLEAGQQSDLVHFAQINSRDGFFLTGREIDDDFQWQTLAGKEVLVDHLFQPVAMLKYALHKAGMEYDSLKVIDAGDVAQMDAAFRAGKGDYVHQQGPAPQQLEQDGIGHIVAAVGDVIGPVAFSSLCARCDWLATDEAKAFTRAYKQARHYVIESPAEDIAACLHNQLPDIDRNVLAQTIEEYQCMGTWEPELAISRSSYETLLDVYLHSGDISQRHAYEICIVEPPS